MPQGVKQRRYQECRGNDSEGGLLAGQRNEHSLQHHDANEIECDQCGGERAIDEGAVYDEIYLVEPVAHYRYPYGDWEGYERGYENDESGPLQPSSAHRFGDSIGKDTSGGRHHRGISRPLDLLAFYPPPGAVAQIAMRLPQRT